VHILPTFPHFVQIYPDGSLNASQPSLYKSVFAVELGCPLYLPLVLDQVGLSKLIQKDILSFCNQDTCMLDVDHGFDHFFGNVETFEAKVGSPLEEVSPAQRNY